MINLNPFSELLLVTEVVTADAANAHAVEAKKEAHSSSGAKAAKSAKKAVEKMTDKLEAKADKAE